MPSLTPSGAIITSYPRIGFDGHPILCRHAHNPPVYGNTKLPTRHNDNGGRKTYLYSYDLDLGGSSLTLTLQSGGVATGSCTYTAGGTSIRRSVRLQGLISGYPEITVTDEVLSDSGTGTYYEGLSGGYNLKLGVPCLARGGEYRFAASAEVTGGTASTVYDCKLDVDGVALIVQQSAAASWGGLSSRALFDWYFQVFDVTLDFFCTVRGLTPPGGATGAKLVTYIRLDKFRPTS